MAYDAPTPAREDQARAEAEVRALVGEESWARMVAGWEARERAMPQHVKGFLKAIGERG